MNPLETEAAGAVHVNAIEVKLAETGAALAALNALGTAEFEANYDADAVRTANEKLDAFAAALNRAKLRFAAAHKALTAARNTATFPRPRGGGK